MAEIALERPDNELRLSQYTVGFNSAGLAFGFRRDRFPDLGDGTNTFRIGLARGSGRLAAGGAFTFYSGAQDLDLGLRHLLPGGFELALVVQHLLTPEVRDSTLPLTGTVGLAWRPIRGVALTAQGSGTELNQPEGFTGRYGAGLSIQHTPRRGGIGLGVVAALYLDDRLRSTQGAIGISIGGQDRAVAVGSGPVRGGTELRGLSLTGLMKRAP